MKLEGHSIRNVLEFGSTGEQRDVKRIQSYTASISEIKRSDQCLKGGDTLRRMINMWDNYKTNRNGRLD